MVIHPFILFLDFDGVLHSRTSGTFRHVPALSQCLAPYPFVKIVISSAWRFNEDLEGLRGWFPPEMANRIIGVTPCAVDGPRSRQNEIEQWVRDNPTRGWCALDDESQLFASDCPWLIKTDNAQGLTAETLRDLDKALALFARDHVR
jgi:hypothetical protein